MESLRSDGYQLLSKSSEHVVNIWCRDQGKCVSSKPTLSKKYLRLHGGAVSLEPKAPDLNRTVRQSSPSYTAVASCCCRDKFKLEVTD